MRSFPLVLISIWSVFALQPCLAETDKANPATDRANPDTATPILDFHNLDLEPAPSSDGSRNIDRLKLAPEMSSTKGDISLEKIETAEPTADTAFPPMPENLQVEPNADWPDLTNRQPEADPDPHASFMVSQPATMDLSLPDDEFKEAAFQFEVGQGSP